MRSFFSHGAKPMMRTKCSYRMTARWANMYEYFPWVIGYLPRTLSMLKSQALAFLVSMSAELGVFFSELEAIGANYKP